VIVNDAPEFRPGRTGLHPIDIASIRKPCLRFGSFGSAFSNECESIGAEFSGSQAVVGQTDQITGLQWPRKRCWAVFLGFFASDGPSAGPGIVPPALALVAPVR